MTPRRSISSSRIKNSNAHVDDWLMTYADMITLLLCFLVLLLAISVPKMEKLKEAQLQVRNQFAPPDILDSKFPKLVPPARSLRAPPSILKEDAPTNANVQVDKSDKITIIEMNSGAFFDSGSAGLTSDGQAFLNTLMNDLTDEKYKNYRITVEGHTDNRPINTVQFPSNWELSAGRAASVVRYLLDKGIAAERLRAAGYADAFPKVPNQDEAGNDIPDNQAQNRRVVIKLEKIDKADPR